VALSGVGCAAGAMVSIQVAGALSRPLVEGVGVAGVTWVRMVVGALVLLAIVRPRFRFRSRREIGAAAMLGVVLGGMSLAQFAAIERLPLGLVVTIAFLGPLGVSVMRASGVVPWFLAGAAGLGVVCLVAPSLAGDSGGWTLDRTGLLLAVLAACGWAGYILLMQRVGSLFSGMEGLSLALLSAVVMLAPAGVPDAVGAGEPMLLLGAACLAVLAPLLPCVLEMAALRKLSVQSFGILMSLEPAIAVLLGLLILKEVPGQIQILGVGCVVLASAGAVFLPRREPRTGRRPSAADGVRVTVDA